MRRIFINAAHSAATLFSDPFFGKRGAAAAAGYSSLLGVAEGSGYWSVAPPRRFAPPLRRRGKRGCDNGTIPTNRTRPRLRAPSS